jgi:hypothetical protein
MPGEAQPPAENFVAHQVALNQLREAHFQQSVAREGQAMQPMRAMRAMLPREAPSRLPAPTFAAYGALQAQRQMLRQQQSYRNFAVNQLMHQGTVTIRHPTWTQPGLVRENGQYYDTYLKTTVIGTTPYTHVVVDRPQHDLLSGVGHALVHAGSDLWRATGGNLLAQGFASAGGHGSQEEVNRQLRRTRGAAAGINEFVAPAIMKPLEGKPVGVWDVANTALMAGAGPLRVGGVVLEGTRAALAAESAARVALAEGDISRADRLYQVAREGLAGTTRAYRENTGLIRPLYGMGKRAISPTLRAFEASPARSELFDSIDQRLLHGEITRRQGINQKRAFDQLMINGAKQAGIKPRDFIDSLAAHDGLPSELHPQQLFQKAPPLEPHVDMPARLRVKGLTPKVYNLIKRGAEYRDWYDRGAAVIRDLAERTGISDKQAAGIVAVTSQSANPTFNLRRAAEAIKAVQRGEDISSTMMGGQFSKVKHIIENPETFDWSGVKTNNYFANFLKRLDPAEYARMYGPDAAHATIDRHMAAMFLGKQAVTEKQYAALKDVMVRTGKALGWSPEEVQAAAWVPWKADQMGLSQEYRAVLRHAEGTGVLPSELQIPEHLKGSINKLSKEDRKALKVVHTARGAWAREAYSAGLRDPAFVPKGGEGYLKTANDAYARGQQLYRAPTPRDIGEIGPEGYQYLYQLGSGGGREVPGAAEAGVRGRPLVRPAQATPEEFLAAQRGNPRGWNLTEHSAQELRNHQLFLSPDGRTGAAVSPEGDLQNVFNNRGVPGAAEHLVQHAIDHGATTLDAYDGFLPKYYRKFGFREVGRMKFNDQFAPEGWDFKKNDRPDIVFMSHNAHEVPGRYLDNWDAAKQLSQEASGTALLQGEPGDFRGRYTRFGNGQGRIELTGKADVGTLQHELIHHLRPYLNPELESRLGAWAGARQLPNGSWSWSHAAEEKLANGWLSFLHSGEAPRNWVDILQTLRPELRQAYDHTDLPQLSQDAHDAFKTLAGHENSSQIGQLLLRYSRAFARVGADQLGRAPYLPRDPEQAQAHLDAMAERAAAEGHGIKASKIPRLQPGEATDATGGPGGAEIRRVLAGRPPEGLGTFERIGARMDIRSAREAQLEKAGLMTPERARKAAASLDAYERAGGGIEGHYASMAALRGEHTAVDLGQLPDLNQNKVDFLLNYATHHPAIEGKSFEQVRAREALLKVVRGETPQKAETRLLYRLFGKEMDPRNLRQFVRSMGPGDWLREIVNLPRSLEATMDQSAMFRHGIMTMAHSPEIWGKQFPGMYRALFSSKFADEWMHRLENFETYPLAVKHGVAFTDLGVDPLKREEQYMSVLAEQIPGFGRIVKASDRSYVGVLNAMRMTLFDKLVRQAAAEGHDLGDPHLMNSIAKFTNSATGRGDLGLLKKYTVAMQSLFFSPRLLASRVNFLSPFYYASLHPFARRQAIKGMTRLLGTSALVLGALKAAGVQVGTDPTSADFGRVRLGNTRLDIFGGYQDPIRLASQLIEGHITSSVTGRPEALSGKFAGLSYADIISRFLESKLAPVPSGVLELAHQQDPATHQPLGLAQLGLPTDLLSHPGRAVTNNFWLNHTLPLVVQDIASMPKSKMYLAPGPLLGVGVHTYGLPPAGQKELNKLAADSRAAGMGRIPKAVQRDAHWQGQLDQAIYSGMPVQKKMEATLKIFDQRYGSNLADTIENRLATAHAPASAYEQVYREVEPKIAPLYRAWLSAVDKGKRAKAAEVIPPPPAKSSQGGIVHGIEHGLGDVGHFFGGLVGATAASAATNPIHPAAARRLAAVNSGHTAVSAGWESQLLHSIGAPATPENLRALAAWRQAEGGTAAFNPLNTTEGAAGASDYNRVGVKNYIDETSGIHATAQTLLNGRYGNILSALRDGRSAQAVAHAVGASPWGTSGQLMSEVLAQGPHNVPLGTGAGRVPGAAQFAPAAMGGFGRTPTLQMPGTSAIDAMFQTMAEQLASGSYNPGELLTGLLTTLSARPMQGNVQGVNFEIPKGGKAAPVARGAISLAEHYLGTPYAWGGESPGGFDCSGLLQYVWAKMGVRIPRTSQAQFEAGRRVGRGQLRPGDAVFFVGSDGTRSAPGHVGMYIGGGKFIEAPHSGATVRVSNLNGYPGYVGARRFH